ncbi:globin [Burkholderia pseudomallei]|nr:globin [Burkholderia pseudomallei]
MKRAHAVSSGDPPGRSPMGLRDLVFRFNRFNRFNRFHRFPYDRCHR